MRILVVEDEQRLAATLRRGLTEIGFAVDVAYEGDDGLAAALSTPYDVLVLDLMLPKLDGLLLTRELRSRRVPTPILMLTARDSLDDRVKGLGAGADDYLGKPFAMRELVARIRALARRQLPDRTEVLQAGPIAMDTSAHTVRVCGQPVELTAKEFAVLQFFLLHQRQLLTRSQIIENVWNYDFDGGRGLIEVYVGRLRRKVQEAGGSDPFVTLRGVGYRFDPRPG